MHVISRDFDSDKLKQPKHWKSFTTDYFRSVDTVISEIVEHGKATIDIPAAEMLLKSQLRCHRCLLPQANLPTLKRHIATCRHSVQLPC